MKETPSLHTYIRDIRIWTPWAVPDKDRTVPQTLARPKNIKTSFDGEEMPPYIPHICTQSIGVISRRNYSPGVATDGHICLTVYIVSYLVNEEFLLFITFRGLHPT